MLNNSITIGLAVISLVCIYLIWENFKQSAKLRYLESSIHETIQTVQGLVNNSLTLPPIPRNEANHNYHPESMTMRNNIPQPVQAPQGQQLQHKTSSVSLSEKRAVDSIQRSQVSVEDDLESVTEEVGKPEELEPLEITEELKNQIDNLTFIEPEHVVDGIEDMEEFEYHEDGDKSESGSESDNDSMNGIEEIKDLTDLTDLTDLNEVVEVKDNDNIEDPKKTEEVKETEKDGSSEDDYIKNPALLSEMSLKELREIAEKHNLGHRGTKEQLVTKIKRNLTMSS